MTKILPIGFRDLIGKEALFHQEIINQLLRDFSENDYIFIKPSLVEFGNDNDFSFQARDLHSGKNIIVRNDITLQIKRLLQTSFINSKFPLKICYSGEIINLNEKQLLYRNVKRQVTQVGLEIIGKEEGSLIEIIKNLTNSIAKFSQLTNKLSHSSNDLLSDIILEIYPVGFFQEIANDIGFEINNEILKAISDKNFSYFLKSNIPYKKTIGELLLAKNFDKIKQLIQEIPISPNCLVKFQNLQKIYEILGNDLRINLDLFNQEGSYHQNIAFNILDGRSATILAKGGEYKINDCEAVGATIYVDEFLL